MALRVILCLVVVALLAVAAGAGGCGGHALLVVLIVMVGQLAVGVGCLAAAVSATIVAHLLVRVVCKVREGCRQPACVQVSAMPMVGMVVVVAALLEGRAVLALALAVGRAGGRGCQR